MYIGSIFTFSESASKEEIFGWLTISVVLSLAKNNLEICLEESKGRRIILNGKKLIRLTSFVACFSKSSGKDMWHMVISYLIRLTHFKPFHRSPGDIYQKVVRNRLLAWSDICLRIHHIFSSDRCNYEVKWFMFKQNNGVNTKEISDLFAIEYLKLNIK